MLQPRFGLDDRWCGRVQLAGFQKEAVSQAMEIIKRRGGVLIADDVGLGKTYIGLAMAEAFATRGPVAVVVPSSLRSMWCGLLAGIVDAPSLAVLSHQSLALGRRPRFEPALVVVDEAHAFRNPKTRRARALASLARRAALVLLSATPVNNSLADLYHLLTLFCADTSFRDIGIGSLRALLTEKQVHAEELRRLRRAVMVRRTRDQIKAYRDAAFQFPDRGDVVDITYEPLLPPCRARSFIDSLEMPAHTTSNPAFNTDLIRFALLKRMDSSRHAFVTTLRRLIHFYEESLRAIELGGVLRPAAYRALRQDEQLLLTALIVEQPIELRPDMMESFRKELGALRDCLAAVPGHDAKLDALQSLLHVRRGRKTVVFTEYRDSARYLWRRLKDEFAVGLIDGDGAMLGAGASNRRTVVERFAPRANNVRIPTREECLVLIATDVLAEGMNLQDADAVVSFDLPWNPVKLIQRSGRVDRMGSLHDRVQTFNFVPGANFDDLLRLVQRLQLKLGHLKHVVGIDRPVLASTLVDGVSIEEPTLKAAYEPPPRIDGIPVGATGTSRTLIGLLRGLDWRVVDDSGRDVGDADRILADCLQRRECRPADLGKVAATVQVVMADLRSRNDLGLCHPQIPSARIARALRTRLSRLPLGEGELVYDRVDSIIFRLGQVRGRTREEALASVDLNAPLANLVDAIECALETAETTDVTGEEWTVSGVLVSD